MYSTDLVVSVDTPAASIVGTTVCLGLATIVVGTASTIQTRVGTSVAVGCGLAHHRLLLLLLRGEVVNGGTTLLMLLGGGVGGGESHLGRLSTCNGLLLGNSVLVYRGSWIWARSGLEEIEEGGRENGASASNKEVEAGTELELVTKVISVACSGSSRDDSCDQGTDASCKYDERADETEGAGFELSGAVGKRNADEQSHGGSNHGHGHSGAIGGLEAVSKRTGLRGPESNGCLLLIEK